MLFVDGENFAIRAGRVAPSLLAPGTHYERDVFVWMPTVQPKVCFITIRGGPEIEERSPRAYYFTSVRADYPGVDRVRDAIRNCRFQPEVFKKKDNRSKQVDIALASRMLIDAAKDNYDVALLIAGDEDYVPAVQGVKEFGKSVYLTFFDDPEGGLSPELRRACDTFFPLTNYFRQCWTPRQNRHARQN